MGTSPTKEWTTKKEQYFFLRYPKEVKFYVQISNHVQRFPSSDGWRPEGTGIELAVLSFQFDQTLNLY